MGEDDRKTKAQLIDELAALRQKVADQETTETTREEAEQAGQKGGPEHQVILDSVVELVVYHDMEHRILWANRAAYESVSLERHELIQRHCYDVWWGRREVCVDCPVAKAIETGRPHGGEKATPDGRTWNVRGYPVRDADGKVIGGVELTLETTEQKRAEEALRRRDAILEAISFAAERLLGPDGWRQGVQEILERLGNATGVSRVYIFQLHMDDQGRHVVSHRYEWAAPGIAPVIDAPSLRNLAYREAGLAHREQALQRGEVLAAHVRKLSPVEKAMFPTGDVQSVVWVPVLVNADLWGFIGFDECNRERVWSSAEVDALKMAANTLSAAIRGEQIEEQRRHLETQVLQAQKLESLGVLAGGIAHDFNNLLTGVLGNAQLAQYDLPPVSPVREYVEEIEQAARRAAELCRQMLAYSGKGRFVVQPIDLSEVVEEMGHLLEVSISKKAALKCDLAEGLPAITADATQIRQIILNLITNASEALGEHSGVISVSTGVMDCDRVYFRTTYLDEDLPEGRYVYVEVADTGCGMDQDTCGKIFEPFFTTKFTGRGLGLAAVLGIVRGHRGAIRVYSEPGEGTTFKVLFPAVDQPATPHRGETAAPEELRGTGTVLLVEDEEHVRKTGQHMLERMGFTVLTAVDGREGVRVFREHADEIDCVLLDLTMPNMDGVEAFQELRRIREGVPVILASGYNEQDATQRFTGKGLAGFVQKPYGMQDLQAKMGAFLAR